MTDAILKLENIVEALSNRDIYSKDMVSTQEINAVMYRLAEEFTVPGPVGDHLVPGGAEVLRRAQDDRLRLKAIGVQVRAHLAKMRKRTFKDSMHSSVELRLAKINKELRTII